MNNQIIVVVGADGRILNTEQNGVFRRSNKQNELIALLLFDTASTVKVNFLRSDGVKPKSQYMSYAGQQEYDGVLYNAYSYILSDFQLYATGPLVVSLDIISGNVTATTGDFTIDVEASEGQYDDIAPTDTNQFDEAIDSLMKTDRVLLDRTTKLEENIPYLVKSIQKVASNAFTYTNNSGGVSEPIVLTVGEDAPIPVNTASKVVIPDTAWQAEYSGVDITGYTYTLTAAMHGQIRDGAMPNDLWVSFDETDGVDLLGAFKRYTIDSEGNIRVYVNQPVTLTVRVWNGKSISDSTVRELITAETERAETAEEDLQRQITELQNTGVDETARKDIEDLSNTVTELAAQVSGLIKVVPFTDGGWAATDNELYYLGALNKTVEVPSGSRIVQILDNNNMPRGTWRNNVIYANEAFAGVAIII